MVSSQSAIWRSKWIFWWYRWATFVTTNSLIKVVLCLQLNFFTLPSLIPKFLIFKSIEASFVICQWLGEYLICLEITLNRYKQSSLFKQIISSPTNFTKKLQSRVEIYWRNRFRNSFGREVTCKISKINPSLITNPTKQIQFLFQQSANIFERVAIWMLIEFKRCQWTRDCRSNNAWGEHANGETSIFCRASLPYLHYCSAYLSGILNISRRFSLLLSSMITYIKPNKAFEWKLFLLFTCSIRRMHFIVKIPSMKS